MNLDRVLSDDMQVMTAPHRVIDPAGALLPTGAIHDLVVRTLRHPPQAVAAFALKTLTRAKVAITHHSM